MSAARGVPTGRVLRRIGWIAVAVMLMVQVVVVLSPESDGPADFRVVATVSEQAAPPPIASEVGPFRDLRDDLHVVSEGAPSPHVVIPTRRERRARRAYDGAPPLIPHPVEGEMERAQDCAPCHRFGGYNPLIRTYTPRVPHPELTECLQCHVPRVDSGLFVQTDWIEPAWPEFGSETELVGGPPGIPHELQMREHCLACHGGASAAPDIRTTHPERFNCRQCHLPVEEDVGLFARPAAAEAPGGGR